VENGKFIILPKKHFFKGFFFFVRNRGLNFGGGSNRILWGNTVKRLVFKRKGLIELQGFIYRIKKLKKLGLENFQLR